MEDLVYCIEREKHDFQNLKKILVEHPEIKFVSLMGIDLGGNATDEKIPIRLFVDNMKNFLTNGIQTDGSSVMLHEIATLNNAKVDLVPDLDVNWFVDYNYQYMDEESNSPVGTLIIPSYLIHNSKEVCSRSALKRAVSYFESELMRLLEKYPYIAKNIDIDEVEDIDRIILTCGTELEFWVKTPGDKADHEKLSTSQMLKEQYWKRTRGTVRTALEKTVERMEIYGFEPEMGHKEVGGVCSKIGINGKTNFVMEQLEIDWKYNTALQAADNEMIIREIVEDVFASFGLEVTFMAKPLEGVAGSGEHTHVGVMIELKNGKKINVFSPLVLTENYLSEIGYGALMGVLKNYEVLNPFITCSNDALNRLKPGFEAPVCIVISLGKDLKTPSRNRSILAGLIRDIKNPLATRFEVRSPNPLSNTYLVLTTLYQAMLDGINAVAKSGKKSKELEIEISKKSGAESFYLEKYREYRSEEDVFEHYTEEERNEIFGKPPATVWENVKNLDEHKEKREILLRGDVLSNDIVESFKLSTVDTWITELKGRIVLNNIDILRSFKKIHTEKDADLDEVTWRKVDSIRHYLMKDNMDEKSLFTRFKKSLDNNDYDLASTLQIEINQKMDEVQELYARYKRNLFDIEE